MAPLTNEDKILLKTV